MQTLAALKRESRWLSSHTRNVYSQRGEDGIVARALEVLPSTDRWCVEFGAWDGKHLSNTFNLVESKEYRPVLIEGSGAKFKALTTTYPYKARAVLLNAMVGWFGESRLDNLLSKCDIPNDFDLLSIDIDGNDYHVWDSVVEYRPKLVLIEYNPTMANSIVFIQPPDPKISQGSSAAAIVALGKKKRYELVATTDWNLMFADSCYFDLFHIPDNTLEVMREEHGVPHIFIGFDGTIFLRNNGEPGIRLPWHGIRITETEAQILPSLLRTYPDNYGRLQRLAFSAYSRLRRLAGR